MRVATAAASSGSAHTRAVTRPWETVTPLVSSTSSAPGAGIAARTGRPVTFGWGPRFLHSTGQFHKGGPATGVFLQVLGSGAPDLEIPERPFTFGQLIQAQAAGDASVLAGHGRPVLSLTLSDVRADGAVLRELTAR